MFIGSEAWRFFSVGRVIAPGMTMTGVRSERGVEITGMVRVKWVWQRRLFTFSEVVGGTRRHVGCG